MNAVIAVEWFRCLASPCAVCIYYLTLALHCAMNNHFRVIVFFEYPCDMDHESNAK